MAAVNIEPGVSMEPDKHESFEQIYFIIEGEAEIAIGEHTVKVKKGYTILIFPNEKQSIQNNSQKPLRYVSVTSPPISVKPIYGEWSKR